MRKRTTMTKAFLFHRDPAAPTIGRRCHSIRPLLWFIYLPQPTARLLSRWTKTLLTNLASRTWGLFLALGAAALLPRHRRRILARRHPPSDRRPWKGSGAGH